MKKKHKIISAILLGLIYIIALFAVLFYVYVVNWQNQNGTAETVLRFAIQDNSPTLVVLDEEYKLW